MRNCKTRKNNNDIVCPDIQDFIPVFEYLDSKSALTNITQVEFVFQISYLNTAFAI